MMTNDLQAMLMRRREALLAYIQSKVADRDLAEDILQESLVKALRSAADLREEEKLTAWFYRIVNNAIIDLYRRRSIEMRYLAQAVDSPDVSAEPEEIRSICECLGAIIPTLKPEYAQVIDELDLKGEDPGTVADRHGILRNNLKVRRHRAHAQLRRRLEETCRSCARHGCLDCSCRQA